MNEDGDLPGGPGGAAVEGAAVGAVGGVDEAASVLGAAGDDAVVDAVVVPSV